MKRGIALLLFADGWFNLALGMLGPIYALFVENIGGDLLDASIAYFIFMFTTGVVMYLIGLWEDRHDHKEKFVIGGYFLTSLGILLYYFVENTRMLFITQIILGFSTALLTPAFGAMYTSFLDKNKIASEWGTWGSMWYIVTGIAALIGGYIADSAGFKTLFLVMFFISLLASFSSLRLLENKNLKRKF